MCHPFLQARWFDTLSADEKSKAQVLFQYVYEQYKKEVLSVTGEDPPKASTKGGKPRGFLLKVAQLALVLGVEFTPAPALSEVECWERFEGGKGEEDDPLTWWKV